MRIRLTFSKKDANSGKIICSSLRNVSLSILLENCTRNLSWERDSLSNVIVESSNSNAPSFEIVDYISLIIVTLKFVVAIAVCRTWYPNSCLSNSTADNIIWPIIFMPEFFGNALERQYQRAWWPHSINSLKVLWYSPNFHLYTSPWFVLPDYWSCKKRFQQFYVLSPSLVLFFPKGSIQSKTTSGGDEVS